MYYHILHRGRKHFCRYCLESFRTAENLKCHIKIAFRKRKSAFMIYGDFESILVPEDNGMQNLNESYTNKYQEHVVCSYGYKLECVDDKFSKPFKSYLDEHAAYNFISSMIKESKYCSDVMKKHFNKEFVMTKKNNKDFENSTKCWMCDNDYIDGDVLHVEIVLSMLN